MSSNLKEKLPDLYSEISETLESAKLILSEAEKFINKNTYGN